MRHSEEQFEQLRDIILPILTDAAAGRFDRVVPMPVDGSHDFNKLLMGVRILLEEIQRQKGELTTAEMKVADVQCKTSEILARTLDRSLPYR